MEQQLAEVVHDLRSPLTAIGLEGLLLQSRRPNTAQEDQSFARIQRNVEHMDRLINELLDVCALATGRFRLARQRLDLGLLIAGVIARLPTERERSRIIFEQPAHPIAVPADQLRVERVVANFVDTALRHTPRSSSVIVRLARSRGAATVSVLDSGDGSAATELARVLQPHKRCRSFHGRSGSGVGLYVSKRIIDEHGGTIGIDPIRSGGSRFFFTLPLVVVTRGTAQQVAHLSST